MRDAIADADGASTPTDAGPRGSATQRLLYRWFVEYNPLYLVSALLVLGGLAVLARAHADQGTMNAEIGVIPVIAEVYAGVLIAGAALLMRIGQRRPAVMLALLTALYQCDLTLFTERSVYLGSAGGLAALAWLVLFVGKLYALAWAMRLRFSPSAIAVATLGALGVAVVPHLLGQGDTGHAGDVITLWVFSLFAAGLWTSRAVNSAVELDAWGRTVLARALKATWLIWAVLVVFHVLFWCLSYEVSALVLLPAALLLATRWMDREATVWTTATGTLLFVGWLRPESMSSAALMAASVLILRALRTPTWTPARGAEPRSTAPYRVPRTGEPPARAPASFRFTRSERDSMQRLLIGAFSFVYLSAWMRGWSGGSLPPHVMALDVLFTAGAALVVWRARTRAWGALVPVTATYVHLAVQTRYVSAPASPEQWGVAAVSLGFGLLVASLIVSFRLRKVTTSVGKVALVPPEKSGS